MKILESIEEVLIMKLSFRLAFLLALLSLFLMAHHPLSDSEPATYIVTAPSGARLRACPQTSCPILRTLRSRTPVTVIGMTTGTSVSNNSLWAVVSFDGQIGYIHSSLVRLVAANAFTPAPNSQTVPQTFEFAPSPPSQPDHGHAESGHGGGHDSGHDGGQHPGHDDGGHTPDHGDPGSEDDLICEEEEPGFHG
jgi:hypothetical protein